VSPLLSGHDFATSGKGTDGALFTSAWVTIGDRETVSVTKISKRLDNLFTLNIFFLLFLIQFFHTCLNKRTTEHFTEAIGENRRKHNSELDRIGDLEQILISLQTRSQQQLDQAPGQ
jgi:hypothetical protein